MWAAVTGAALGAYQAYFTALKPVLVNVTVALHPSDPSQPTIGPYSTDQANLTIPAACDGCADAFPFIGPIQSIDITASIPAIPWYDGNCFAVELRALGADVAPTPVAHAPLPALAAVDLATTVVVANFEVLADIDSQGQLDSILQTQTSQVFAKLDGYVLTIPIAFTDFNHTDCSVEALANFTSQLAYQLGINASQIDSTCAYAGSTTQRRARRLRQDTNLTVDTPQSSPAPLESACGSDVAKVYVDLGIQILSPASGAIADVASRFEGIMFSLFGQDSFGVCSQYYPTSLVTVYKLASTATSSRRELVTQSPCHGMSAAIPYTAYLQGCSTSTYGAVTGTSSSQPSSSGSTSLSSGAIAGICVGAVAGVALIAGALAAFVAVRRRSAGHRKAIGAAMQARLQAEQEGAVSADTTDLESRAAVRAMATANAAVYKAPLLKQQASASASASASVRARDTLLDDPAADPMGALRIAAVRAPVPEVPQRRQGEQEPLSSSPNEVPRGPKSFRCAAATACTLGSPALRELPICDAQLSDCRTSSSMRRSRPSSPHCAPHCPSEGGRPSLAASAASERATPRRSAFDPETVARPATPTHVTLTPVEPAAAHAYAAVAPLPEAEQEDMASMVERMLQQAV